MAARRQSGTPKLYDFVLGLNMEVASGSGAIDTVFRHIPGVTTTTAATTSGEPLALAKSLQQLYASCVNFSFPDIERLQARFACGQQRSSADPAHADNSTDDNEGDDDDDDDDDSSRERFSFVLTDEYGTRYFGYTLRFYEPPALDQPKAFVVCSRYPLFSLWSHLLQELVDLSTPSCAAGYARCAGFLERVAACRVPSTAGETFRVPCFASELVSRWPFVLPDVNDSPLNYTDVQPLLRYVQPKLLMSLFASVLLERRFVFIAPRISTLCAVVQAFVALLFPLQWHHTYIPLLPRRMIDICSAPVPFIVGMQSATWQCVNQSELEADVVIVDIGAGALLSPPNADAASLPAAAAAALQALLQSLAPSRSLKDKLQLKKKKRKKSKAGEEPVDLIPPKALVAQLVTGLMDFYNQLLTGYRSHYRQAPVAGYDFDKDGFIASAHPSCKPFLEQLVHTQLFEQFVAERADKYTPARPPPPAAAAAAASASRFSVFQSAQEIEEVRRLLCQGAHLKTVAAPTPATAAVNSDQPSSSPLSSSGETITPTHGKSIAWGRLVSLFPATHASVDLVVGNSIYSVGRSEHCLVRVTVPQVSWEHCKFVLERPADKKTGFGSLRSKKSAAATLDSFYCYDQSTNGTFVNGRIVGKGKRVRLQSGDFISLAYSHDSPEAVAGFQYIFGAVDSPAATQSGSTQFLGAQPSHASLSIPCPPTKTDAPPIVTSTIATIASKMDAALPPVSKMNAPPVAALPPVSKMDAPPVVALPPVSKMNAPPVAALPPVSKMDAPVPLPRPSATAPPQAPPRQFARPTPAATPPARPMRPQLSRTQSEWLPRVEVTDAAATLPPAVTGAALLNLHNSRLPRTGSSGALRMPSRTCPHCSRDTPASARFCTQCGQSPAPPPLACHQCATPAPPGKKFCSQCGASLAASCPSCAASAPPAAKFCRQCGASLVAGR